MVIEDVFKDREKGRLKEIQRVKHELNKLSATICKLDDKYIQDLIDVETYNNAKKRYQGEKMNLEKKLEELETSTKAFLNDLTRSLSLIENLNTFYIKAFLEDKKKLLTILFPEKLILENGAYRTHQHNIFYSVMLTQLRSYEEGEINKAVISDSLSRLAPLIV